MSFLKLKLFIKKVFVWAKKFWWALVLALGFVVVGLLGALTRNGAYLARLLDLIDSKTQSHAAELETITQVHETEVAEKNKRVELHLRRKAEIEEEFKERGEEFDKKKDAELKKLVDEGYNDPEKLARDLAKAFGLKHG